MRSGFRSAIKPVCVANPVSSVDIDTAPLMSPRIRVFVFIKFHHCGISGAEHHFRKRIAIKGNGKIFPLLS